MIKIIIYLIFSFTLIQCGKTGPLNLPKGVDDKSCLQYPPELNEDSDKTIISKDGKIVCDPEKLDE